MEIDEGMSEEFKQYIISLNHQPNDYKNESEADIDLVLCGHTHGAQMIPTNIYVWIKNTVFCGLYSYLDKYFVYCVSGVGNSGPPLRTFSRANIGLISLVK